VVRGFGFIDGRRFGMFEHFERISEIGVRRIERGPG
jgi:hypothetical protein